MYFKFLLFFLFIVSPLILAVDSCNGTVYDKTTGKCTSTSCETSECLTCSTVSQCILCPTQKYIYSNSSSTTSCVLSCPKETYLLDKTVTDGSAACLNCNSSIKNCAQCSDSKQCTQCESNFYLNQLNLTDCKACKGLNEIIINNTYCLLRSNATISAVNVEDLTKVKFSVACDSSTSQIYIAAKLNESIDIVFDDFKKIQTKLGSASITYYEDWTVIQKVDGKQYEFALNSSSLKNGGNIYQGYAFCYSPLDNVTLPVSFSWKQPDNKGKNIALNVFYDKPLTELQKSIQAKAFIKIFNITRPKIVYDFNGPVNPNRFLEATNISNSSNSSNSSNGSVVNSVYVTNFVRDYSLVDDNLANTIIESLKETNYNTTLTKFNEEVKKQISLADYALAVNISLFENPNVFPRFYLINNNTNLPVEVETNSIVATVKLTNTAGMVAIGLIEASENINITLDLLKSRKFPNGTVFTNNYKRDYLSQNYEQKYIFANLHSKTNYSLIYAAYVLDSSNDQKWTDLFVQYVETLSNFGSELQFFIGIIGFVFALLIFS